MQSSWRETLRPLGELCDETTEWLALRGRETAVAHRRRIVVKRNHITKRKLLLDALTVKIDPSANLYTELVGAAAMEHVDKRALGLVTHERWLFINEPETKRA